MHKATSRAVRGAVATGAAMLLASGAAVATAPVAAAGTCSVSGYLCGQVINRTGRTMAITTSLGSGPHYCDVWNWGGGSTYQWKHAACRQITVGNGTFGGNGTGYDVDAFTFPNQGYHERFSRLGTWNWRTKGVWTKVRDGEYADCSLASDNAIWCTVLWQ